MYRSRLSHERSWARWFLFASLVTAACADQAAVTGAGPQFSANSEHAALVEVGEHSFPAGLLFTDASNQLLLLYRWNDGFCGGTAATEFVQSTYRDVIQMDERWRTLDKTEGMWFYVYPWNGASTITCAYLRSTAPLATGRGTRLIQDNDFYPFAPYGPGPGANAYFEKFQASLTTPGGENVQFLGMVHLTMAADGQTIRQVRANLQLSPDPR